MAVSTSRRRVVMAHHMVIGNNDIVAGLVVMK